MLKFIKRFIIPATIYNFITRITTISALLINRNPLEFIGMLSICILLSFMSGLADCMLFHFLLNLGGDKNE